MSTYNRKYLTGGREEINRCRNFFRIKLTFSETFCLKIEEKKMASAKVDNFFFFFFLLFRATSVAYGGLNLIL